MAIGPAIRVLQDPPLDGSTNMSRDEALMTRVGKGESHPTLRLYQWSEPTISLGYFQKYSGYEDLPPPEGNLPVVRRLTGGGAILHDVELTYSLALPTRHPVCGGQPSRLYQDVHRAIIETFKTCGIYPSVSRETDNSGPRRGPFFCFARRHRYDLLIGTDKLVGSAQRRTRAAILQHGSIILAARFPNQPSAQVTDSPDVLITQLRQDISPELRECWGHGLEEGMWTNDELDCARSLVQKYRGNGWTARF